MRSNDRLERAFKVFTLEVLATDSLRVFSQRRAQVPSRLMKCVTNTTWPPRNAAHLSTFGSFRTTFARARKYSIEPGPNSSTQGLLSQLFTKLTAEDVNNMSIKQISMLNAELH